MPSSTLSDFFSRPAFFYLFPCFIIALINVFIGINIHPHDKRKKDLHRYLYYVVMVVYLVFLIVDVSQENRIKYAVLLYWLFVVPWCRGNVTRHAIFSSVGLVLFVVTILL